MTKIIYMEATITMIGKMDPVGTQALIDSGEVVNLTDPILKLPGNKR